MSKFTRDSFLALGGEAVMFAGSLLYGLITARALGPSGKGIIGALLVSYGFIVTILSLRFERAIAYYSASRPEAMDKTVTAALVVGLGTLACFLPLYWALPDSVNHYLFGGVSREFIAAAIVLLPSTYLHGAIAAIQAGRRRFESRLGFLVLTNVAKVAAAFVALVIFDIPLWDFIVLTGTVEVVIDGLILVALFRRNKWTLRLDLSHLRSMMQFSLSALPGVFAEMAMMNAPILILSAIRGSFETGLLIVSVMVTNTLAYMANAVKVVVLPHVASSSGTLDEAKLLRLLVLIELAMALGLIVTGRYLISLVYGAQFDAAFVPALILIPGVILSTYYTILTASIQGRGKPGLASIPSMIGAAFAIGVSVFVVQDMGILGAAAAKSVAGLASALAATLIYSRLTLTPFDGVFRVRRAEVRELVSLVRARISGI